MRTRRMYIVVIYDISDDKRRTKLYKKLKNYGTPVQLSAFEFNVTPSQKERLINTILEYLDEETDRVSVYELCENCRQKIERFSTKTRRQPITDDLSSMEI